MRRPPLRAAASGASRSQHSETRGPRNQGESPTQTRPLQKSESQALRRRRVRLACSALSGGSSEHQASNTSAVVRS
eukprot:15435316-Alexandrium_andersonii.AAC.1